MNWKQSFILNKPHLSLSLGRANSFWHKLKVGSFTAFDYEDYLFLITKIYLFI